MMCNCADQVETELRKKNTTLDKMTMVNMKTGRMREALQISTRRLDPSKNKTKVIRVAVSFCPFCGSRLKKGE